MQYIGQKSTYSASSIFGQPKKGSLKFSMLFHAVDNNSGERFILKALHPNLINQSKYVERFVMESSLQFNHPSIVNIIDNGVNPLPFMIMEIVEGINLKEFLQKSGLKGRDRVFFITDLFIKIAEVIVFIHNNNVVHGDIKPSNIMLSLTKWPKSKESIDYIIKIIDFGQAHFLQNLHLFGNKEPFSLIYSPPEQVLQFHNIVGRQADIYSFATTMYEALIGKPPFKHCSSFEILALQLSHPLKENKLIPPQLFNILLKATSKYRFPKPPQHYSREERLSMLIKGLNGRYSNFNELISDLMLFKSSY